MNQCFTKMQIQRWNVNQTLIKFKYSENATKFCEISTVDLSYLVAVKSTGEILQNFVAFSEYMNFKSWIIIMIQKTFIKVSIPLRKRNACELGRECHRISNHSTQLLFLLNKNILGVLWKYYDSDHWVFKVQLFWEGHKNLLNFPHGFDIY